MCSRDPNLVEHELRRRMLCTVRDFRREHPTEPQPVFTCTVRTPEQQAVVWAQGRTTPGKIITWAQPGESPHNSNPSMAVDIGFRTAAGPFDWSDRLFTLLGRIAQRYGIEWGGSWVRHPDLCHFQVPGWKPDGTHNPWPEMPAENQWPGA